MPYNPTRRNLTFIRGGEAAMGPVERMKWREQAPILSMRQIAFLMAGKLLLLASVLYFMKA